MLNLPSLLQLLVVGKPHGFYNFLPLLRSSAGLWPTNVASTINCPGICRGSVHNRWLTRLQDLFWIISANEVVHDTTCCDNFGLGCHGIFICFPKDEKVLLGHPKLSFNHILGL